jgi:hypothetical protein
VLLAFVPVKIVIVLSSDYLPSVFSFTGSSLTEMFGKRSLFRKNLFPNGYNNKEGALFIFSDLKAMIAFFSLILKRRSSRVDHRFKFY